MGKYKDRKGTTRVGDMLRSMAEAGKNISKPILEIASKVTGIESLEALGDLIINDGELNETDKQLLLVQLEYDKQLEQEITKRWEADLHSDSWLSKNIRPLTLCFLLLCMFMFILLDSSLEGFKINEEWIGLLKGLLMTAVGGYFVIRGGEKITNKIFDKR